MIHKSLEDMKIALYAGSFNPFTVGHMSILRRGLQLFDRVVVAVGVNAEKQAEAVANIDELKQKLSDMPGVDVILWSGLTVDAATQVGAKWLLRGVRSVADYEYERNLADINKAISGIDTVILFAEPELSMVSSSMVRELRRYGRDVSDFVI